MMQLVLRRVMLENLLPE